MLCLSFSLDSSWEGWPITSARIKGTARIVTVSKRVGRSVWWKWAATLAIMFILGTGVIAYAVLRSLDFNSLRPTIVKAVKDATGRDLVVGHFGLQIGFTPMLVVENLALRNPKWAHRLDLVRIRRLEIHVELLPLFSQKIVMKRLVMVEPDVQLEISKSGLSNFDLDLSSKRDENAILSPKLTKLPEFAFHEILLKNVKFSLKSAESTEPIAVWFENLEAATKGPNGPIQLRLKGMYRERAFTVQALTGSLEQLLKQNDPWPLEATIEALGAHSSVRGDIADLARIKGVNLSLTAEGRTTNEIRGLLNVGHFPEIGAFKLAAKVFCPELGIYNISDLRLHINGTEISSTFQIRTSGKRPKISGMLNSQNLDLRPFLHRGESTSENRKNERVFSDKPIETDALTALDGEFKIRAKRIITPYGSMQNVQMDALLKDSRLTVKPLKAIIGGGVAEVHGVCRAEGNNVVVSGSLQLDNLELDRVLKDLRTDDAVDGTVGGDVEFNSFGHSVASLMANLSGKTVLTVGRGRIKNHFVRLLGGDLSASVLGLFGASKSGGDYTDIECAVGGLDIRGGLAKVTALVVDTPETTVRGSGEVDLKTERLDLSLEPLPKRGVAGLSLSLGELAKPFRLSGTLAAPSLAVDPAKTALTIGKAIAGVVLFGPLGIAGALAGKTSDRNPCAAALEAARKGSNAAAVEKTEGSAKYGNVWEREREGGY